MKQFPLVRNPLVWLRRIAHRRGYGVHSPFAFQLITGAIYESTPYYAYSRLASLHPWLVRVLNLYPLQCHRMLFRLANYQHPSCIVLLGASHHEAAYMQAAVPSAQLRVKRDAAAIGELPPSALLFVGAGELPHLAALADAMPADGMLVVEGIHSSTAAAQMWHEVQAAPHTGITFDLYTYGICCFDRSRHKQHYIVNF